MPDARVFLDPVDFPVVIPIHARLYRMHSPRPHMVDVEVRYGAGTSHVYAETVLSGARVQPYVHTVEATYISRNGATKKYTIFFKRHVSLRKNRALGWCFRGDALVVSKGVPGMVHENMESEDYEGADRVAKKLAQTLHIDNRIPQSVVVRSRT